MNVEDTTSQISVIFGIPKITLIWHDWRDQISGGSCFPR